MRRASAAVVLVVLTGVAGCEEKKPLVLKDSEGRTFEAVCKEDDTCTIQQKGGPEWPDGKNGLVLHRKSRLLGVCSTKPGDTVASPGDCRALVCDSDASCPPAHGLDHGACVNGTCTEQSEDIRAEDAVMLCLWGLGLGRATPAQVDRLSMGLNCGTPCEVPTPCRQY